MKDFIKWLGINEKVAKIVVWIMIAMIMLILTNILLESVGLPFYKITVENIGKITSSPKIVEYLLSWIVSFLNFCSIVFLVIRVKEFKKVLPYAVLYLVILFAFTLIFKNYYIVSQIFIIIYVVFFCYFFSGKNKGYLLYGMLACVIDVIIQYACYLYKARFIDFSNLNQIMRTVLGIDHFVVVAIVIFVKEIYLKKRGETIDPKSVLVGNIQQRKEYSKQNSKTTNKKH